LKWFEQLKEKINRDDEYIRQARWLMGPMLLRIGERAVTVYFHKGRIIEVEDGAALTGTDFAVVGPEEAWERLIRGEVQFPRALSATGLRIEGNLVKAAGNMRALCHLFKTMSAIPASEAIS
jgi:putative sterol carrier protein